MMLINHLDCIEFFSARIIDRNDDDECFGVDTMLNVKVAYLYSP